MIGAGAGKVLHKKTGSKLEEEAGKTIPLGGAGLIVAYKHDHADMIEPAVTRAIKKVVGEAEGHHVEALKGRARRCAGEDGCRGWMNRGRRADPHS